MPINLFDAFVNDQNTTYTLNGQAAFATTTNPLVDFFSLGGAMRQRSEQDIINLFQKAYEADPTPALRLLFYFRDIRGGQGERRLLRTLLKWVANNDKQGTVSVIPFVPHLGRFDDLFVLFDTPAEGEMIRFVKAQLEEDIRSENVSLLAKWLPSTNTSSPVTRQLASKMRKALGYKQNSDYMKTLVMLRKKINILESQMSANKWGEIEYDKIPSRAGLKYRTAFHRHDEERYVAFLEQVKSGEKRVKATTLYPYDIAMNVRSIIRGYADRTETDLYNALWKELPNYVPEGSNTLVMADISASMTQTYYGNVAPIDVALSLAVYTAERNTGFFQNAFMTYSDNPQFLMLQGDTFVERMKYVYNQSVHYGSTNVYGAFRKVLDLAIQNSLPQEQLPTSIMVISDMQFNQATSGSEKSITLLKREYEAAGYTLPVLIFWNVNASTDQFPTIDKERNTLAISGASPSILKSTLSGKFTTPVDLMNDVINNPRYAEIHR